MKKKYSSSFISQTSQYRKRNEKNLINFLINQFKFSRKLALIIIEYHQCSDKMELLSLFILNDNNCYQHAFISFSNDRENAVCEVCHENQNYHTNFITLQELKIIEEQIDNNNYMLQEQYKNSFVSLRDGYEQYKIQNYQNNNYYKQYDNRQYKLCSICYKNILEEDMIRIHGQKHQVCVECMGEYLKQKILNLKIHELVCPHCDEKITAETVREYVSNVLYEKFVTFSRNIQIQKNPNLKWCPNPRCCVVISTTKKRENYQCPKCLIKICYKCNQQHHPKRSCDEILKTILKNLQNASDIQKCQNCKSLVQKISGCNHMTCKVCQYQWCWLCGSTYSSFHFSLLNPFGCPGMQSQDSPVLGKTCIYMIRILMILGFLVLSPIVIPVILIVSGPIVIFQFLSKQLINEGYDCGICLSILLFIFVSLPLGIVFDPVIWIGGLIYFLPQICQEICDWFQRRRQMIQQSQNSLRRKFFQEGGEIVVTE